MSSENLTTKAPDEVSAHPLLRQIHNVAYNLAGTKEEGCEVPLNMEVAGLESIINLAGRAEDAMSSDPEITTQIQDLAQTMAAAVKAGMKLPSSNYHVIEALGGQAEKLLQ